MAGYSLIHNNYNLLCAIQIITTGSNPEINDMIQVCILPLDSALNQQKAFLPFYTDIIPRYPENLSIDEERYATKQRILTAQQHGIEFFAAADLLDEWMTKLKLQPNKKIMPLAYCWHEVRDWLIAWLGKETFNQYFDYRYRDILSAATFLNDKADFRVENVPVAKVDFSYICSSLKVERDSTKETTTDCLAIAEVYRRLVKF
jgi:hypothetical protein